MGTQEGRESGGDCLPENCVRYRLYPELVETSPGQTELETLDWIISKYYAQIGHYLTDYIWQQAPFNLHAVPKTPRQAAHIEGQTRFGDNVDDEWFIVYLLLELTKRDASLVVQVEDSDGDFLLIEAAEVLPEWVDPETSVNRVYLSGGGMHLIPLHGAPIPPRTPTLEEAVDVVRRFSKKTKCVDDIQATISRRIKGYPEKIKQHKQRARCFVPAAVAALLTIDESLISHAVQAFYTRDAIDLKAAGIMKYFPPENRVLTNVTLTRCLYAQLRSQQYKPDAKIGWEMPTPKSPQFKAHDLGMKIASGFEILVAACAKDVESAKEGGVQTLSTEQWARFEASLTENGYYRGLLKGSKGYKELSEKAQRYFTNSIIAERSEKNSNGNAPIGLRIRTLLKTLDVDFEKLKETEAQLLPEDDDSWLNISSVAEFDELLNQQFNSTNTEEAACKAAANIPDALDSFVKHDKSGLDGAEFPPKSNKVHEKVKNSRSNGASSKHGSKTNGSAKGCSKPRNSTTTEEPITFDIESFGNALHNILTLHVPHSDTDASSSSGMSDYEKDETEESLDSEDELFSLRRGRKKNTDAELSSEKKGPEESYDIKGYMDLMDRELAKTNVGLSFERQKNPPLATIEDDEDDISDDSCETGEDYKPVDVDLNALKNILESYSSQAGLPGPAGNLLSSMGVFLPKNADILDNKSDVKKQ